MMTVKIIFMVIMVVEFVANIGYTCQHGKDSKGIFWAMLFSFVKLFLFIWIVSNRAFF